MSTPEPSRRLRWNDIYSESELYKAALRVYTKPLFQWRKALSTSTDGKTLYDLAAHGLRNLDALHHSLKQRTFDFRAAVALRYNFNGRHRTLYIAPWEERIVDFMLYRILNRQFNRWFSSSSYAYRDHSYGLDRCQSRIAAALRSAKGPVYVVKRDVADYFASVNHDLLLGKLAQLVDPDDYLFHLLKQRVCFRYQAHGRTQLATMGIPFGTAVACLLANIFLAELDHQVAGLPGVMYFRYADDILLLSESAEAAKGAAHRLDSALSTLHLRWKPSHMQNLLIAAETQPKDGFVSAPGFRYLGLLFRPGGEVGLSRDKFRKMQNLFRFAFRRSRRRWKKLEDPRARAQALVELARETIEKGVRNVAIIDYYLKHVNDERQLCLLDRWLAQEILSAVFGGHKRSHFRRISFHDLRVMGLPSLVHRRRLIRRKCIESPFFIWQRERAVRAFRGTVARLPQSAAAFSPIPEAAASTSR
jgi:Reverse transcriptase (RNA-dependent DNA polymerase)